MSKSITPSTAMIIPTYILLVMGSISTVIATTSFTSLSTNELPFSRATLLISQYAHSYSGKYHIMASVLKPKSQDSAGFLLGSTYEPLAPSVDEGRISFAIRDEENNAHNVVIKADMPRWKIVDADSADLVIEGFPESDDMMWSSEERCVVGEWKDVTDLYDLERQQVLGTRRRDFWCFG